MGVMEVVWLLRFTGYAAGAIFNALLLSGSTESSDCEWCFSIGQFPTGRVAHAGGIWLLKWQRNTQYAVQKSYSQGFRFIELDFMQTSDGVWVCQYSWEGEAPAYLSFAMKNNKRPYPFCDLAWLVKWQSAKKNLYLVLDTKQENALDLAGAVFDAVSNDSGELQYWIPQAYNIDDLMGLRSQGFPNIIYTLYKHPDRDIAIRDALSISKTGVAFTLPSGIENYHYGQILAQMGFPVFYHTVNSQVELEVLRTEGGAVDVYSDRLLPD